MKTWQIVTLLAFGIALVLASLALRIRSGGKDEVKATDLAFLVVPLIAVGVAAGKIKGVDMFGVKADLSALWAEAAKGKIQPQVSSAKPADLQDVHGAPRCEQLAGG